MLNKSAPENYDIPVEPDAADVVDQTDLGIFYLNVTGLIPEL